MKLVPRLCSPGPTHPTPRRVASPFWSFQTRFDGRPPPSPSPSQQNHSENVCTRVNVERVVEAIVVMQSVIAVTETVTVSAARALIARVCSVTYQVFNRGNKTAGMCRGFRALFRASRRVASIVVTASRSVIGKPSPLEEEREAPPVALVTSCRLVWASEAATGDVRRSHGENQWWCCCQGDGGREMGRPRVPMRSKRSSRHCE